MHTLRRLSLEALPPEIILQICFLIWKPQRHHQKRTPCPAELETAPEKLQTGQDTVAGQPDLAALGLTCRRMLSIVQPQLYANPVIIGMDIDGTGDADRRARGRFQCFCNTLQKYPHLAEAVASIEVAASAVVGNNAVLEQMFPPTVPNLESVCLWLPGTVVGNHATPHVAAGLGQTSRLPVHTLQLRGQDASADLELGSDLFQGGWLSKVQTLDLRALAHVEWTSARQQRQQPPLSQDLFANLTTFRLWHNTMNMSSFETLLGAVGPCLSSVSICVPEISDGDRKTQIMSGRGGNSVYALPAHGVVRALLPWAHTLRSLTHTVAGHCPFMEPNRALSDLTSFVALDSLWLESEYFSALSNRTALTDALPPGLSTLRLSGLGYHAEPLEHLCNAIAEGKYPALASVAIDEQGFDPGSEADGHLTRSLSLLRTAGVDVTVLPLSTSDDAEEEEE